MDIASFQLTDGRSISVKRDWSSGVERAAFLREVRDGACGLFSTVLSPDYKEDEDALHCGLIDWGRVGQISFGSALWGGLSAAHPDIWDRHLGELLTLFVEEYRTHAGPAITVEALEMHLTLHMAAMGVARVLAFPEIIQFRLPDCVNATGPRDPMFRDVDPARNCLTVYSNFLSYWHKRDFGAHLDRLLDGKAA